MSRTGRKAEQLRLERLADALRSIALRSYIHNCPYHDTPGWEEMKDYSKAAWVKIAEAMLNAGWTPPAEGKVSAELVPGVDAVEAAQSEETDDAPDDD